MKRWKLLLVGKNNGLVGEEKDEFTTHPAHYDRVMVVEESELKKLQAENAALKEVYFFEPLEKEISVADMQKIVDASEKLVKGLNPSIP